MKKKLMSSVVLVFAGAGLAVAQPELIPVEAPGNASAPPASTKQSDMKGPAAVTDSSGPVTICDDCDEAPRRTEMWLDAEYLLWWFKDSPVPVPLATTAPAGSTAAAPGAVGNPDTSIVIGGRDVETEERQGGRFRVGGWLDNNQTIGVEGVYLFVANRIDRQAVSVDGSPGAPILAVPIFDVNGGVQSTFLTTVPGSTMGTASLANSGRLQGAEGNVTFRVAGGQAGQDGLGVELLAGFRWLHLREDLTFTDSIVGVPGTPAAGLLIMTQDAFGTRNNFFGGQIGVRAEYAWGKFVAAASAKAALGEMHEEVTIGGFSQTNVFNGFAGLQTFPGGVFAQPDNSGRFEQNHLSFIPEVGVNVGYQLAPFARVYVGYNFLYVTDVARPGSQMNPQINVSRTGVNLARQLIPVAGPPAPTFTFQDSNFWAQGINFGAGLAF